MSNASSQRSGSKTLIVLASLTLAACVAVLVGDFVGSWVAGQHNPISETISKLAIGESSWIQDYGLNLFAGGIAACAAGLFLWNLGCWRWRAGAAALVVIALDILVISEYDYYKGFDDFGGTVHMTCVYILYSLVGVSSILLGFELSIVGPWYRWLSLSFAGFWLIVGPLFLFATPTSVDGAVERLLAIGLVAWIGMLGWLLLEQGRGRLPPLDPSDLPATS